RINGPAGSSSGQTRSRRRSDGDDRCSYGALRADRGARARAAAREDHGHPALRRPERQANGALVSQHQEGGHRRLPAQRAGRRRHSRPAAPPRADVQRARECRGCHAARRAERGRAPGAPRAVPAAPATTRGCQLEGGFGRLREEAAMSDGAVKILDGNTFVVSDSRGDIEASLTDPTGLFSYDTRFLSKWVLTVNDQRLNPLSVDDLQYFETRFFLVPGTGTVYVDAKLSVIRQRAVGDGFHEELTILNHDEKPVDLTVRLDAGCDFADLFEVKDALEKKGKYSTHID